MKIENLQEKFSDYEIRDVNLINPDMFIYSYVYEGYEGTGFAVWRRGNDWFYDYLGHCSCNGPTENFDTANRAVFTYAQVKDIASKDPHGLAVINYIEENKLNE